MSSKCANPEELIREHYTCRASTKYIRNQTRNGIKRKFAHHHLRLPSLPIRFLSKALCTAMTSSFTKYTIKGVSETKSVQSNPSSDWFCSTTAIYKSKYKSINLPTSPILEVVSFIFSFEHNGVSALIDSPSGFSLSYLHLHQTVNSLGYGVLKLGISKGDTVLIILPNTISFPVIFLGVISIGATATTMNPRLKNGLRNARRLSYSPSPEMLRK